MKLKQEFENWKSQIVISNSIKMGLRKLPLVFTEQGVAMLSSVLHSERAIQVNIQIIRVYTKMRQLLIDNKELGEINYIDSTRINLGLFQPDVNVLWDLAAHDISICHYLLNEKPTTVQATGISHTNNGIENIAYLTLKYASNKISHFNCSWTSPVKVRQMLVGGDKKMILWNDLDVYEKIKIYDTGYEIKSEEDKTKILVDYRVGDIFVPKTNDTEALFEMAADFVACIQENKTPRASAEIGATVVKILEASQISIKNKGIEVEL